MQKQKILRARVTLPFLLPLPMADKGGGAYASKAADTDFRKKWDKEEYAERARKKDQEEKERMQENEERMKQGQVGPAQHRSEYLLSSRKETA
jgi:hypothetical protein